MTKLVQLAKLDLTSPEGERCTDVTTLLSLYLWTALPLYYTDSPLEVPCLGTRESRVVLSSTATLAVAQFHAHSGTHL